MLYKEMIYRILTDKKSKKQKIRNAIQYKKEPLKVVVPLILSKKIDTMIQKNMYNLLRNLIDIYEDRFSTNFDFKKELSDKQ